MCSATVPQSLVAQQGTGGSGATSTGAVRSSATAALRLAQGQVWASLLRGSEREGGLVLPHIGSSEREHNKLGERKKRKEEHTKLAPHERTRIGSWAPLKGREGLACKNTGG